jgi:hypothetical protein
LACWSRFSAGEVDSLSLLRREQMRRIFNPLRSIWYTIRLFMRAPFERIPPEFGDTVPPELRAFEAEADEIEHHPVGEVSSPKRHGHQRSKPTR